METKECILTRYSCRKYLSGEVRKNDIREIIEAGMSAPSAMNRRPYEVIVSTDNAFLGEYSKLKSTCEIFKSLPLTILVVADENKNPTREFLIEDGAALTENMLLRARDLGYGSLWAGIKWDSDFQKALKEHFALPDGYLPLALIGIGVAGEKKVQVSRYDESKVHFGKF